MQWCWESGFVSWKNVSFYFIGSNLLANLLAFYWGLFSRLFIDKIGLGLGLTWHFWNLSWMSRTIGEVCLLWLSEMLSPVWPLNLRFSLHSPGTVVCQASLEYWPAHLQPMTQEDPTVEFVSLSVNSSCFLIHFSAKSDHLSIPEFLSLPHEPSKTAMLCVGSPCPPVFRKVSLGKISSLLCGSTLVFPFLLGS